MEGESKSMPVAFYTLRSRVMSGLEGYHIASTAFETPLHMHDAYEIFVLEEGTVRTTWRRTTTDIEGPAVVVMPFWEIHAVASLDPRVSIRGVHVSADALTQAVKDVAHENIDMAQFGFDVIKDAEIARSWKELSDCICQNGSRSEQETKLGEAAAKLFVHRTGTPLVRLGAEHQAVEKAVGHIRANFAADVSLEELGQVTGLSKFHLIRIFRRAVGVPPHVYLIQLRVAHARKLLRDGMAATDAAQAVGFTDLSHLIRHFRKSQGFLPGVYARSIHIPVTKDYRIHGRYDLPSSAAPMRDSLS